MANPYVKQTWTDGVSALSAARLGVIETGIYDAHIQPAARAYHNANQSIANATNTALTLNSERFDQDGLGTSTIHDNATNNSRLTCRVAGIYQITGCVNYTPNATGIRYLWIMVNGATNIGSVTQVASNLQNTLVVTALWSLAVNDYAELYVHQTSGGALNVEAVASYSPELMMSRVG